MCSCPDGLPVLRALGWLAGFLVAPLVSAASAYGVPLVEAHRGYSAIAPENTLASIRAGAGIADLTEWDVRVTADGALVLMHDATVDRTTNGAGAVASLTLSQIKALDAGAWFSPAYVGEPVPTMADAISTAAAAGITPLIEAKSGNAVAYHNEFVSLGLSPSTFRLISFDWGFLNDLDGLNAGYNLGALGSGALDQSRIDSLQAQGVDFIDWNHNSVTQATVDLVHASGMELHVWTVNDPTRMQQLIEYGVDGITTDEPETLRNLTWRWSADLNQDGLVDVADWQWYHSGRGLELTGLTVQEAYQMGDMDGDFDNDVADFLRFKKLYLEATVGLGAEPLNAIPEPTAMSTAIVLCLLLLRYGERRGASVAGHNWTTVWARSPGCASRRSGASCGEQ